MSEKIIKWTKHFEERLKERFKIELTEDHKENIRKVIERGPIFCKLDDGGKNAPRVYQVVLFNKKIMVVVKTSRTRKTNKAVTVYRRSWFSKSPNNDGTYLEATKVASLANERDASLFKKQLGWLERMKLTNLLTKVQTKEYPKQTQPKVLMVYT